MWKHLFGCFAKVSALANICLPTGWAIYSNKLHVTTISQPPFNQIHNRAAGHIKIYRIAWCLYSVLANRAAKPLHHCHQLRDGFTIVAGYNCALHIVRINPPHRIPCDSVLLDPENQALILACLLYTQISTYRRRWPRLYQEDQWLSLTSLN